MDWSRAALVGIALLVAGTIVVVPVLAAGPPLETTAIQHHDDHWWVLASNSSTAVVSEYDGNWERTNVYRFPISAVAADHDDPQPVSFVPARGEGWWLLTESGHLSRFDGDWQDADQHVDLSSRVDEPTDIARSVQGWWILGNSLVHYGATWNAPVDTDVGARTGDPRAVAHGSGSLQVMEVSDTNHPSGWVHQYETNADAGVRPTLERTGVLDWETNRPTDIAEGDQGQVVLESDGHVLHYTDDWQYTGDKQLVVESAHEPFLFGDGAFLVLTGIAVIAFWLFGVAILVARSTLTFRTFGWLLATGSAGVVCSVLLVAYLLPSPLSFVYRLPDVALGGILLGILAFEFAVMRAFERDTSLRRLPSVERSAGLRNSGLLADFATFCLVQVPLLVTAWLFVS